MHKYSARGLGLKIALAGMLLPIIFTVPLVTAFYFNDKNSAIESQVKKAKAICQTAKIVESQDGCEFVEVTTSKNKFSLRFKDRHYTDVKQTEGKLKDFYEVDESHKLFFYTSFVRARRSCVACHGDPDKTKKLWVRTGKNQVLPAHLTGIEEGEVVGAYEFTANLSESNAQRITKWLTAGLMLFAGISIYSFCFLAVTLYFVNQYCTTEKTLFLPDWQIFDFSQDENKEPQRQISPQHQMQSADDNQVK